MAGLEAAYSIFSSCLPSFLKFPISSLSTSLRIPISKPSIFFKAPPFPLPLLSISQTRKSATFKVCSAVEEIIVEEKPEQEEQIQEPEGDEESQESEQEETEQPHLRKKLFVHNLPWTLTVVDIRNLFGECGTVADIEIIKKKDGKSRGYAFITMASGEEAQAVIDKFDSHELLGRIIRVAFSKRLKRPPPPPPASPPVGEPLHQLYLSNLAWKVRSSHLREFFAANFNPVAVRVVFDGKKSAGYGFASFTTKEEAESAMVAMDGKELLGRPLRITHCEKKIEESKNGKEEEAVFEKPPQS